MQSLRITGKQWFDKKYGNTYFSSQAYIDGKPVASIGFHYGHVHFFEWAMFERLEERGIITDREHYNYGAREAIWRYCERKRISYATEVARVARKKDL